MESPVLTPRSQIREHLPEINALTCHGRPLCFTNNEFCDHRILDLKYFVTTRGCTVPLWQGSLSPCGNPWTLTTRRYGWFSSWFDGRPGLCMGWLRPWVRPGYHTPTKQLQTKNWEFLVCTHGYIPGITYNTHLQQSLLLHLFTCFKWTSVVFTKIFSIFYPL